MAACAAVGEGGGGSEGGGGEHKGRDARKVPEALQGHRTYRIYNPDNVDCEVADVTTDGAASQSRRQLQMDEPYLMSEAIDQLVEEFGGEDAILASIPYE